VLKFSKFKNILQQSRLDASITVFKELQLIQHLSNYSIGQGFAVPFMIITFSLSTFAEFALISFHHVLDPTAILVIVCCLCTGTLFPTCYFLMSSRVTSLSVEVLTKFSHMSQTKLLKSRVRSIHPLLVHVGVFFYARRNSILIYFSMVVSTVINLVLSFGV